MNSTIIDEQELPDFEEITNKVIPTEIIGIDIPIGDMILFMIKWGFATVPVAIFFAFVWWIVTKILFGG